jgi:MOSC domain-containing protein YiiM
VTIQSRELLEQAAADLGHPIDPGATRRNLTVDAGDLPTRPGARLRIEDVELEVVRVSAPCRLLDDWISVPVPPGHCINEAARSAGC